MDMELNAEESRALREAIRSYCSDLRMEIVDTDNASYKRGLRDERAKLESVLTKLDDAAREASSGTTSEWFGS